MDIPQNGTLQLADAPNPAALSSTVILLLKGPLYAQEKPKIWSTLLEIQQHVRTYLSVMNLALYLDEAEGYCFLRQIEGDSEDETIPRLIHRRPLGYAMSVLCILLRQWLSEHDIKGGEVRAIIDRQQIYGEMALYLPQGKSEAKFQDKIDGYIHQAEKLGLLRELKGDKNMLEILRITKALINAEWLGDLKEKLQQYKDHATQGGKDD